MRVVFVSLFVALVLPAILLVVPPIMYTARTEKLVPEGSAIWESATNDNSGAGYGRVLARGGQCMLRYRADDAVGIWPALR